MLNKREIMGNLKSKLKEQSSKGVELTPADIELQMSLQSMKIRIRDTSRQRLK